ncbi:protein spartin [Neocloeon triangulifer]|uniref:protein spartin n=1 Tax=Neocloeon triangulifer TaxID=2078957 RepID=UPI00286EF700|nr:protein spartin [Neocloeon triangulifer]
MAAPEKSGSSSSSPATAKNYAYFKKLHDAAFRLVENGIELEQDGRTQEAVSSYESGLGLIDKALEIYIESDSNPQWDTYFEQIVKMKNAKKDVQSRLATLQRPPAALNGGNNLDLQLPADPPSYEEATSPTSPYATVSHALNQIRMDNAIPDNDVLYRQDGVRMYFIAPDGNVSSLSEPLPLTIAQVQAENEIAPTYYMHIGSWVYPLVPGVSPMLHSKSGALIIPDLQASVPGSTVGLILPEDADGSVLEILDDLLQGILQPQPTGVPPPPIPEAGPAADRVSQRISQGIVTGAQYLSFGLVKGAEYAGSLLNKGTPVLIQHLQPANEPKPVSRNVKKSLKVARDVTGTAVTVTSYIAGKVGAATMSLGRFLAPHVQAQGTKLLTSMSGLSENEASSRMEGALEVTAGAVHGFTTVYGALENAATILAKNLADNTVQVVQHKYGPQAGEVAEDTLATVGNAVVAGHTAQAFTVKGIAKKTAKNAGKALVEDYQVKVAQEAKEDEDEGEEKDKNKAGPSKN